MTPALVAADTPTGTLTVLAGNGRVVACRNARAYEVGDGDLIVVSNQGRRYVWAAGEWAAVGTLERTDGLAWVAIERFAGEAA